MAIVAWMTIAHWTAFHDAAELSENAGGVDNATAVIGDHRPNNCLMAFEVAHSACFVCNRDCGVLQLLSHTQPHK